MSDAAHCASVQVLPGLAAAVGAARGQDSQGRAIAMAQAVPERERVVLAASTVIA